MNAAFWFWLILLFIVLEFVFESIVDRLNIKARKQAIPQKLQGIYTDENYARMQAYHTEKDRLGTIQGLFTFAVTILVLGFGIFGQISQHVATHTSNPWLQAVMFFALVGLASFLLGIGFSWYNTFVIEEKYGFNKTTVKTFILDFVKGLVVTAVIMLPLSWVLIWIYQQYTHDFWWIAFSIVFAFSVVMAMFYTSWLLPLFNKLTPLPDGELKQAIEAYCVQNGFQLKHLFVMDGSKRSTRANAFFSGLGPRKTIVLFDTLVNQYSKEEIVAVLAHEVGHFKHKHVLQSVGLGAINLFITFYVLSYFLSNAEISAALGSEVATLHLGVLGFALIFSPVGLITGIFSNLLSRKNEYEADAFAQQTYSAGPLISALKKLSADSFSNLTPHPFYVFLNYSHPTLLQRMEAMEKRIPANFTN